MILIVHFLIVMSLIYTAGSRVSLSMTRILHCLLKGVVASHVENVSDKEKDANENFNDVSLACRVPISFFYPHFMCA